MKETTAEITVQRIDHVPVFMRRGFRGVMECLENFITTGGEHGGDADQEGVFRRQWAAKAERERKYDGCSRSRGAWESGGDELSDADGDRHGPGHAGQVVVSSAPAAGEPAFDDEEEDAARQERDGDWEKFFRQFEAFFSMM